MPTTNVKLLENFISYCSVKNKAISKNIANVGTEDYKREDVTFKNVFDDVNGNMYSKNNLEIDVDKSGELTSGINNVDIDKEMSDLAENTIRFKFASRQLTDYFKNMQSIIKGGGGS